MSNRFLRPLILGLIATITASASYALIVPVNGSNFSRVPRRLTHTLAIPQFTKKEEAYVDSVNNRDIQVVHKIQAGIPF